MSNTALQQSLVLVFFAAATVAGQAEQVPSSSTAKPSVIAPERIRDRLPAKGSSHGEPSSCLARSYRYPYTISAGIHAGDVWECCAPIDVILGRDFRCTGDALSIPRPTDGTANDQKIQHCTIIDPRNTTPKYIPACRPSPVTAPTNP